MTKLPTPKNEGDKMTCTDCGMPLVARLKIYKDNTFPAYVQWQNANETKAHKTKDGNCAGITTSGTVNIQETVVQSTVSEETIQVDLDYFELEDKKLITKVSTELWQIKKQVELAVKDLEVNPNGGMIWEMTKIIHEKHFGDKKN